MPSRALAALSLAVALAGCDAGEAGSDVVRRDSAGIEIVENPAEDRPIEVALTEVRSIGGADAGPESFFEVRAAGIETDASGHVYVLDRGNRRIVVFDSTGNHVHTLGKAGGGPGELENPFSLAVTEGGEVLTYDLGSRSLVSWGPEGELEGERPTEGMAVAGALHATDRGGREALAFVRGSFLLSTDGEREPDALVWTAGDDTTGMIVAPEVPRERTQLECGGASIRMESSPLFSPGLRWDGAGRRVAAVADAGYRVDLFRDGRHVRSVRRPIAPRETTPEMGRRRAEEMDRLTLRFGGRTIQCDPADFVEKSGMAPRLPVVEKLALAPDGTLWVERRSAPGEDPAPVDLFDPGGTYLGSVPGGTVPFPAAFLPDGRVVALEEDELEVQRVVIYRIDGIRG